MVDDKSQPKRDFSKMVVLAENGRLWGSDEHGRYDLGPVPVFPEAESRSVEIHPEIRRIFFEPDGSILKELKEGSGFPCLPPEEIDIAVVPLRKVVDILAEFKKKEEENKRFLKREKFLLVAFLSSLAFCCSGVAMLETNNLLLKILTNLLFSLDVLFTAIYAYLRWRE